MKHAANEFVLARDARLIIAIMIFICFIALVFTSGKAGADRIFAQQMIFPVGNNPENYTAADFNHDGILDIATANQSNNSHISLLIGTGDGFFEPERMVNTQTTNYDIEHGDFNGDNHIDLISTDYTGGRLTLLLGNGDGTFRLVSRIPVGSLPRELVIKDINADSIPDVAVAMEGQNLVKVLFGNGDGTFQTPVSTSVIGSPVYIDLADVNSDSILDLVVSNSLNTALYLGVGDGTFQVIPWVASTNEPKQNLFADLDNNSTQDIIVSKDNGIAIYFGNGDGTFLPRVTYPVSDGTKKVDFGFIDPDPFLDMVVSCRLYGNVHVYLNQGDGSFANATHISKVGQYPMSVLIEDFNGDGYNDFSVSTEYLDTIQIILADGSGSGSFMEELVFETGISRTIAVDVANINDDMLPDLLLGGTGADDLVIMSALGNAQYESTFSYSLPSRQAVIVCIQTGDFNEDGVTDLAFTLEDEYEVYVMLGNIDGTFEPPIINNAGLGPDEFVTHDFDHDGHLDFAVLNLRGDNVTILLGNGDGTFQMASVYPSYYNPINLMLGDFNNDLEMDILVIDSIWTLLLGNGDGTFQSVKMGKQTYSPDDTACVGDLNEDGNLDVVEVGDDIEIFLGNGDGTFVRAAVYSDMEYDPIYVEAIDLDDDTILDLVIGDRESYALQVHLGYGNGEFEAAQSFPFLYTSETLTIYDINGDNKPDAILPGYRSERVNIWLNTSSAQKCTIGGLSVSDGGYNPDNPCQKCDVSISTTTWVDNDYAPCDDGVFCNGADQCLASNCAIHAGDPCDPFFEYCREDIDYCMPNGFTDDDDDNDTADDDDDTTDDDDDTADDDDDTSDDDDDTFLDDDDDDTDSGSGFSVSKNESKDAVCCGL